MATKVIYFTVGDSDEQAEFRSDDSAEEIRDVFRAAAEAGPSDILKLYNTHGNLVNINPKLAENTPDTRYRLDCIAVHFNGPSRTENLSVGIEDLEQRLESLEKRICVESGDVPEVVTEMKRRVDYFREKLENVSHLSWLGLYKDISSGTSSPPFWSKSQSNSSCSLRHTPDHCKQVFVKFLESSQNHVSDEIRTLLKQPTFDNWQWEDSEMLLLLRQMFIDLDLISQFNIELPVLHLWLFEIYKHYNKVPFHNFKHCFMVSQMMYGLIWIMNLPSLMEPIDILSLLVASISHDLDHPGYNNTYQVNAGTELAMRYNDLSPLENHHCSVAFEILHKPHCNIFCNLQHDQYKRLRKNIIMCILATDMSRHKEILDSFEAIIDKFDIKNSAHKDVVKQIMIKVADISNEARPLDVADPWIDCLLTEFFHQWLRALMKLADVSNEVRPSHVSNRWAQCLLDEYFIQLCQIIIKVADVSNECRPPKVSGLWLECLLEEYFAQSDVEKLEGLPVADFMDRDKVTKAQSQIGFIKFVLQPLFEALGRLFPEVVEKIVVPVRNAYQYYVNMANEEARQKAQKQAQARGESAHTPSGASPRNGLNTPSPMPPTVTAASK